MSVALYREFRPKTFDDVIGQDYVIKTLKNQIKTDRLTHAYLFYGPRGTGKTSTARIFAKAINCTHSQDGNPCGMCAECVALSEVNTDIVEIDAASNNRVEEIRDLREKVSLPPLIGKYKVYIIDEVHMLTDSAFNALLKTLEEPPKHVIFILATTEIYKLPATILSRCVRFDFRLLPVQVLVNQLKEIFKAKKIKCDEKSLYLIAKAGQGSDRDMLSIADSVASFCDNDITIENAEKVIGVSNKESIKDILVSIKNHDINSLFKNVKLALNAGKNIQVLTKEMADFIKNLIMIKYDVTDYTILDILPGEFQSYLDLSANFEIEKLKAMFTKFANLELELKYSLNPENLFESACLELCSSAERPVEIKEAKPVEIKQEAKPSQSVQSPVLENVDRIWGSVLLKVKEKNMFALSNALSSVNRVTKIGNKIIIRTNDQSSYEMIDNRERLGVILDLVKMFDDSIIDILVEYDKMNASSQDIKDNLKDVFKSKLKFK